MSCYLRHLADVLDEASIRITHENRWQIDQAIHQIVGVTYKNCPSTWKKIKEAIRDDQKRRVFIDRLQSAIN